MNQHAEIFGNNKFDLLPLQQELPSTGLYPHVPPLSTLVSPKYDWTYVIAI